MLDDTSEKWRSVIDTLRIEATRQIPMRLPLNLSILVKVRRISYKASSQLPGGTEDGDWMKKVTAAADPKTADSWARTCKKKSMVDVWQIIIITKGKALFFFALLLSRIFSWLDLRSTLLHLTTTAREQRYQVDGYLSDYFEPILPAIYM